MRAAVGKVLYGALFAAVLPALLVLWARATVDVVTLPAVRSPSAGATLIVLGGALMLASFWALAARGGGLPMNAFPPPRYVTTGPYALFAHPIYVGFSGVVLGVVLSVGSAPGLWLVWPSVTLGSVALVHGYERHDLVRRFGVLTSPRLALPPALDAPPTWWDRAFVWSCVGAPWVAIYMTLASVVHPDPIDTTLPFERRWPVIEESELLYGSVYFVAFASPLLIRTRAGLRELSVRALLAMALVFPLYLAFPFVAPPRPFVPHGALGLLLLRERALDTAGCALPSFHVVFALLLGDALAKHSRLGRAAWLWALGVAASCSAAGMHTVIDVATGFLAWLAVRRAPTVWETLRRMAERLASSWHEVRFGPVRVLGHGVWAALGTAIALAIVGAFARERPVAVVAIVWAGTLVGAGAWAQLIEGSAGLSRPYGFWGGLLGATAGGLACAALGESPWLVLGAVCVSAPFIQSLGRLRCLVQGCCHGALATPRVGIVHGSPWSRVAKVPELVGKPLYPTALFSIAWNVVVALVVVRLAWVHAPAAFVGGAYLIVAGLGRFVEESYRGEPQTPIHAGLRLYQWVSIASILCGAVITALARGPAMPVPALRLDVVLAALAGGALNMLAFGVDFPGSQRRLSRLA
jgi:prolipoprotein diacylglyceryltransferase/protein-S-isoprenylcysteine O-methyltransferase Ste14